VVENRRPLHAKVPDLGQVIRAGGYDAFFSGKWHIRGRKMEESFQPLVDKGVFFGAVVLTKHLPHLRPLWARGLGVV
jgi:arylsulfatase A-like enzyme